MMKPGIAAALTVVLVGCGSATDGGAEAEDNPTTSSPTTTPAADTSEVKPASGQTLSVPGLRITLPTGTYSESRPVNIGENRVTFSPYIGIAQRFGTVFTAEATPDKKLSYAYVQVFGDDQPATRQQLCQAIPFLELDGQTDYCHNRAAMLALSSAIYFQPAKLPRLP